jgi:Fe-S cluster biosynthesis and repair protein YggX
MPITWNVSHRVLHGIYDVVSDVPSSINELADEYEGPIKERIGWNLPMSFIKKERPDSEWVAYSAVAEYIIVYRKGDRQTLRHELQHAKYHMDPAYQKTVQQLWASLTASQMRRIRRKLLEMSYPDKEEVLRDEFQAYYFTEKPHFFGKLKK